MNMTEPLNFKTTKLSDKAVEVKLTIRRTTLVKRDMALTNQLQRSDSSAFAMTKLFREGPVRDIMAAVSAVYAYHVENTIRAEDKRLVLGGNIFEYTNGVRHLIAVVDSLVNKYLPVYDQLVQDDINRRNFGKATPTASLADYPTALEFSGRIQFDLRVTPLPNEDHPLFDMSPEDKADVARQFDQMLADANNDVVERMLVPMQYLAKRLEDYKGEKGQRFHTATLENILDGCRMARKLAIDPRPELLEHIAELERTVSGWVFNVEQIKGDAVVRENARAALVKATAKMQDYFQ